LRFFQVGTYFLFPVRGGWVLPSPPFEPLLHAPPPFAHGHFQFFSLPRSPFYCQWGVLTLRHDRLQDSSLLFVALRFGSLYFKLPSHAHSHPCRGQTTEPLHNQPSSSRRGKDDVGRRKTLPQVTERKPTQPTQPVLLPKKHTPFPFPPQPPSNLPLHIRTRPST